MTISFNETTSSNYDCSGCNNKCEEFDHFPEFDSLTEMPNTSEVNLDCIDDTSVPRFGFISLQSEYESVFGAQMGVMQDECDTNSLPIVDFAQRSIIWFYTTSQIANTKLVREGDTLSYFVKVKESIFATARFRMNCVSIPKIEPNDTIVFKPYTYGCN